MYNRYMTTAQYDREPAPVHEIHTPPTDAPAFSDHGRAKKSEGSSLGFLSGLSDSLNSRLKDLHFDLDTLVIIIAVYFLIADSEDFDTDLLILIGIMFFLGL